MSLRTAVSESGRTLARWKVLFGERVHEQERELAGSASLWACMRQDWVVAGRAPEPLQTVRCLVALYSTNVSRIRMLSVQLEQTCAMEASRARKDWMRNASLTEETKMRADMRGIVRGPAECDFATPAGSSVLVTVRGGS